MAARPHRACSEADIHRAVIDHWRAFGLPDTLVCTLANMGAMGQAGLTPGLPDLFVLGGSIGCGTIELKAEGGRVSPAQAAMQSRFSRNGVPYVVTFGRDEPIAQLERWGIVRTRAR